jgi:hypothetical protein
MSAGKTITMAIGFDGWMVQTIAKTITTRKRE